RFRSPTTSRPPDFSPSRSERGSCVSPEAPRTNVRRRPHEMTTGPHEMTTRHDARAQVRSARAHCPHRGALLLVGLTSPAAADDDPRFHRTTPRGAFGSDGPELLVGVPGGRAWGIESELRPVPDERSSMRATIQVADPAVREAFVPNAVDD